MNMQIWRDIPVTDVTLVTLASNFWGSSVTSVTNVTGYSSYNRDQNLVRFYEPNAWR